MQLAEKADIATPEHELVKVAGNPSSKELMGLSAFPFPSPASLFFRAAAEQLRFITGLRRSAIARMERHVE